MEILQKLRARHAVFMDQRITPLYTIIMLPFAFIIGVWPKLLLVALFAVVWLTGLSPPWYLVAVFYVGMVWYRLEYQQQKAETEATREGWTRTHTEYMQLRRKYEPDAGVIKARSRKPRPDATDIRQ